VFVCDVRRIAMNCVKDDVVAIVECGADCVDPSIATLLILLLAASTAIDALSVGKDRSL